MTFLHFGGEGGGGERKSSRITRGGPYPTFPPASTCIYPRTLREGKKEEGKGRSLRVSWRKGGLSASQCHCPMIFRPGLDRYQRKEGGKDGTEFPNVVWAGRRRGKKRDRKYRVATGSPARCLFDLVSRRGGKGGKGKTGWIPARTEGRREKRKKTAGHGR